MRRVSAPTAAPSPPVAQTARCGCGTPPPASLGSPSPDTPTTIDGLVFTPDGQTVLSSGSDRTIQAWDPATGAVRYVLRGHSDSVHDLALSPDGRTLASASSDKTCILWDLAERAAPRDTSGTYRRGQHGRLQPGRPNPRDVVR